MTIKRDSDGNKKHKMLSTKKEKENGKCLSKCYTNETCLTALGKDLNKYRDKHLNCKCPCPLNETAKILLYVQAHEI